MPKRVAINISLPDKDFKKEVLEYCEQNLTTPSHVFVKVFARFLSRSKK